MSSPSQIFWFLLDPWLFMAQSLSHLPQTILHLHSTGTLLTALLHPSRLQSAWFGTFWATAGPGVRDTASARVIPLLEGSVANGQVVVVMDGDGNVNDGAVEKPGISGTVLEVGPGTGMWLPLFSKLHLSGRARITRIYGVEPNPDVHAALRLSVAAAGLEDTYEVVPLGVEDLAGAGRVARESVDCIVSILCLCGVPDPEFNIREMYGYLKPGGFVNIVWPHLLGGCQLCRDTPKMLREAGPWTKIDLGQPESEPWYHPLPHILGTLTK